MPANDYFVAANTPLVIKAPAAVTADGNTGGVDVSGYTGKMLVVAAICNTAGTTPTMDIKLQSSVDTSNLIITNVYTGTGNGTITEVKAGPDSVAEDITIHMDSATGFTVTGSVSSTIGTGTVGTKFTSSKIEFLITAGTVAFVHTDEWAIHTHAHTWADITDAAFTQVTDTQTIQTLVLETDALPRYIRANMNIEGTNVPSYIVGITGFGMTI